MQNMQIDAETYWMILGDFNLIRKVEDRNRTGGNLNDMLRFNAAISSLGITEIVLQGRKYTWSNMQNPPLLEKLDWVFTSSSWNISFPSTSVSALDMIPSDHCPCVVQISSNIPKSKIFRFENFWLKQDGFQQVLTESWAFNPSTMDSAKIISAKFKHLRIWQRSMVTLKTQITNVRSVILFLEILSDHRDLSLQEWNFQNLLQDHLLQLLQKQKVYWKQRGNTNWVQLGDAGTHFFHANATIRHRRNLISTLSTSEGINLQHHKEKEDLLWQEFKNRMGVSDHGGFTLDPATLIQRRDNLHCLED
jgi:hypothetical protein